MVDIHNSTDVERALTAILNQSVSNFYTWCQVIVKVIQSCNFSISIIVLIFCIYISDWAVPSLWVYLWGDAPEGQCAYWKTGRRNVGCGVGKSIRFVIRKRLLSSPLFSSRFHFCLRTSATVQGAGPHWARSRLWRQRPTRPVNKRATRRGWSVNLHSSHIWTALRILPSMYTHATLHTPESSHVNVNLFSCFSACMKHQAVSCM